MTKKIQVNERQARARALVEKIGKRLAQEYETEIVGIFRKMGNLGRYIEIARAFIPYESENFPGVAEKAVGYAVKRLVPEAERIEITRQKRAKQLENIFGGFDSEPFRQHCKRASASRHIKHGVDAEAMTRGRGFIPWANEERAYVISLMENGKSYEEAGQKVNQKFHNGEEIRSNKSIYDMIRYENRRGPSQELQ